MVSQLKTPRKEYLYNQHTTEHGKLPQKLPRIARCAVKQGARLSMVNQAEVENCTTRTKSSNPPGLQGFQDENASQTGPLDCRSTNKTVKEPRQKWAREGYKQVMKAYYLVLEHYLTRMAPIVHMRYGGRILLIIEPILMQINEQM